ncbi:MAG: DUF1499 domain-containing protein [Hyphomicrobiales bacterium]
MSAVDFEYNGLVKMTGGYQGASFTRMSSADDPRTEVSRSAVWARRTAPLAFATVVLGALLHRFGAIPVDEMLAVLGAGAFLAFLALGMCLNSFMEIWQLGVRGLMQSVTALFISLVTLTPFVFVVAALLYLPKVNGVTTNVDDPPLMLADIALARTDVQVLSAQQAAYPGIQTQEFPLSAATVYDLAIGVASRQKLTITFELPPIVVDTESEIEEVVIAETPKPREKPIVLDDGSVMRRTVAEFVTKASEEGVFEASAKTPILGFSDDFVVRVRTTGEQSSIVDVRSASRIGNHDLGTNSRRVKAFLRELDLTVKATTVK